MALNALKCNHLTLLGSKGLMPGLYILYGLLRTDEQTDRLTEKRTRSNAEYLLLIGRDKTATRIQSYSETLLSHN